MCKWQETEGKLRQGKIQLHTRKEAFLVKEVKHHKGYPEVMDLWRSLRIEIQLNKAPGNLE